MKILGVFVRQLDLNRIIQMVAEVGKEKDIEFESFLLGDQSSQIEERCQRVSGCRPGLLICSMALSEKEEEGLEYAVHTRLLVRQLLETIKAVLPNLRVVLFVPGLRHIEGALFVGANWGPSRSYKDTTLAFHFRRFLDYKIDHFMEPWEEGCNQDLGWKP